MTTLKSYDSYEAMQADLAAAMKAADAVVHPKQAALKVGDFYLSYQADTFIFGEVLETYKEKRLQHYRYARAHSVICPDGELGDVHVCVTLPITSEQFRMAEKLGWVDPEFIDLKTYPEARELHHMLSWVKQNHRE